MGGTPPQARSAEDGEGGHLYIRELIRSIKQLETTQNKTIWTQYEYDPLEQLRAVRDDHGNITEASYDLLGRLRLLDSPDAGLTETVYDRASNVVQKITSNLRAESQAIAYDYQFNRLDSITYPNYPENDVTYTYGPPSLINQPGNRVGRIIEVTDESGVEERAYGKLGELTQQTKTVASDTQGNSDNSPEVWTTTYLYDTWGRLQQMTYPDGEVLTYTYDSGGLVSAVDGLKLGNPYPYVQRLEHDKFAQRAYVVAGNGVPTTFHYDAEDRRLTQLLAGDFQDLRYQYDEVGNILSLENQVGVAPPQDFGGSVEQTFGYDDLNRLTHATGQWRYSPNKTDRYELTQSYDTIHNILHKNQRHEVLEPGGATVPHHKTTYDWAYTYGGSRPHAASQIGEREYFYDKDGNQLGWDALTSGQQRSIDWDEEDRIQEIHDNGRTTGFKYNDAGDRVIKRGEQGETAYVNQFWTVRNRSVGTKHIFVGPSRIASKLVPGDEHVQPGADPYAQVLGQWWLHRSEQGWQNGQNVNQNPHYAGASMPDLLPEDNFAYFYHPDHLGSSEWVTDREGELYEHVQYFPFGETWVSERSNTERLPYLFTSKELDEETGLYYFGARYYDPRTSVWQSTDPILSDTLAGGSVAPHKVALYTYTANSPLVLVDPSGMDEETASSYGRSQEALAHEQRAKQHMAGVRRAVAKQALKAAGTVKEAIERAMGSFEFEMERKTGLPVRSGAKKAFSPPEIEVQMAIIVLGPKLPGAGLSAPRGAAGAKGAQAGVRFDPARGGHIFREAAGHVNPGSAASQARFARLFENVASNPANLRADAVQAGLIKQQAADAGVQAFTWTGRSGQVWATVRNGVIQNAGVNPLGAFR